MKINSTERLILIGIKICVIAPILYLAISTEPWRDRGCVLNETTRFVESFSGTVTNKYIDRKNHSFKTVVFKDGTKIAIINPELYGSIETGDSLEKKVNTFVVDVYKRDTIISLVQKQLCGEPGYLYYNP